MGISLGAAILANLAARLNSKNRFDAQFGLGCHFEHKSSFEFLKQKFSVFTLGKEEKEKVRNSIFRRMKTNEINIDKEDIINNQYGKYIGLEDSLCGLGVGGFQPPPPP